MVWWCGCGGGWCVGRAADRRFRAAAPQSRGTTTRTYIHMLGDDQLDRFAAPTSGTRVREQARPRPFATTLVSVSNPSRSPAGPNVTG